MDATVKLGFDGRDLDRGIARSTSNFRKGVGAMNKEMIASRRIATSWAAGFSKMMGPALGAIGVGAGIAGLRSIIDEMDRLGDMSRQLGTSAESLQRVNAMAKLSGTSAETLVTALARVNKAIDSGEAAKAFEELRISTDDYLKLEADKQVLLLADAFQSAQKRGAGLSESYSLFGRQAKELLPLLRTSREELERISQVKVISQDQMNAIQDFNDSLDQMALNIKATVAGTAANRLMELAVLTRALTTPAKPGESFEDVQDRVMGAMGRERGDNAFNASRETKLNREAASLKEVQRAIEGTTAAEVKRVDVLDDLLTKLEEERELTVEKSSTPEQIRERHLQKIAQLEKLIGDAAGRGDEVVVASLMISREQHTQAVLELEKAITTQKGKQAQEEDKIKGARMEAIMDLQVEMKLLELKLGGHKKAATALEREARIRKEAAEIAKSTGMSEKESLEVARRKATLEEKATMRADGRRRTHGYTSEQRAGNEFLNPFRNLDLMKGGRGSDASRKLTPGIENLHRINSWEERNGVLVRPVAFPVTVKGNEASAKSADAILKTIEQHSRETAKNTAVLLDG